MLFLRLANIHWCKLFRLIVSGLIYIVAVNVGGFHVRDSIGLGRVDGGGTVYDHSNADFIMHSDVEIRQGFFVKSEVGHLYRLSYINLDALVVPVPERFIVYFIPFHYPVMNAYNDF